MTDDDGGLTRFAALALLSTIYQNEAYHLYLPDGRRITIKPTGPAIDLDQSEG